ncbi:phosphoribosylanthranilate isomerase [Synechococcus sp. CS-1328]|uniref:phosphoribosylanthranilate isomerase n=1 Tax=Synechococcus sp. CS-1328 TaxID=2847976 RepID=UPI00223BA529|nr:phosphoribosylanthranilate isomerase [Synechococcus sp. CS-1328]MCT0226041.1 phosphoribosylanthranilate isomerase [Synechococcus sp. CS-1328]
MTRVKICGIRRLSDALLAVHGGANAVGVLVGQKHASSDFIAADLAAQILAALPPFVSGVLVSHLEDPAALIELIEQTGARVVQVHGAMSPQGLRELRRRIDGLTLLKAIHIQGPEALEAAAAFAPCVDALLADSANPRTGQVGGTGLTHDWHLTARIRASLPVPLILAGGLDASNVGQAIEQVQPFGVDVNSGVKGSDGFKDPASLHAFLAAVRHKDFRH